GVAELGVVGPPPRVAADQVQRLVGRERATALAGPQQRAAAKQQHARDQVPVALHSRTAYRTAAHGSSSSKLSPGYSRRSLGIAAGGSPSNDAASLMLAPPRLSKYSTRRWWTPSL